MRFKNVIIPFIKAVLLINLVYFGGNDCLSLELNIYKNLAKLSLKPLPNLVLHI